MIGLCEYCGLKYADCKGNKDLEKLKCEYYKKRPVQNVKQMAERIAELEAEVERLRNVQNMHNSDIISRAEALNTFGLSEKTRKYGGDHSGYDTIMLYEVQDALEALPSAEAMQGWIPFTRRPMTEEEQKDYPNCTFMFDCVLPDDGDEILVSNGRFVWMDVFCNDIDGCYLDSGDDIDEGMAWMPLPKPYKGGAE
jgi:hypothetical protein